MDSLLFAVTGYWGNGIHVSSDLGVTWTEIDDSAFGGLSVSAVVATRTYLIAGTQNGGWRAAISDLLTSVYDEDLQPPTMFGLRQNYPNPFNPSTTIQFELARESQVSLKVFNILGQEVANLVHTRLQAGSHRVTWDAAKAPTGVYFYRLMVGEFVETRRMILLK